MKYLNFIGVLSLITLILSPSQAIYAQSDETVRKTREKYEKTHPNKRTYSIVELVKLLDPADSIMPGARAVTHEKWQEISGAVFGASDFWQRKNDLNSADAFTVNYFQGNGDLRRIILNNILTDTAAFQRFMEAHKEKGFHSVVTWIQVVSAICFCLKNT